MMRRTCTRSWILREWQVTTEVYHYVTKTLRRTQAWPGTQGGHFNPSSASQGSEGMTTPPPPITEKALQDSTFTYMTYLWHPLTFCDIERRKETFTWLLWIRRPCHKCHWSKGQMVIRCECKFNHVKTCPTWGNKLLLLLLLIDLYNDCWQNCLIIKRERERERESQLDIF